MRQSPPNGEVAIVLILHYSSPHLNLLFLRIISQNNRSSFKKKLINKNKNGLIRVNNRICISCGNNFPLWNEMHIPLRFTLLAVFSKRNAWDLVSNLVLFTFEILNILNNKPIDCHQKHAS